MADSWTVVQFVDDSSVEAVPSTCIQGNYCHWRSFPPYKLINALRKAEPLNTCWPSHQIKIFRNATFGKYWQSIFLPTYHLSVFLNCFLEFFL